MGASRGRVIPIESINHVGRAAGESHVCSGCRQPEACVGKRMGEYEAIGTLQ